MYLAPVGDGCVTEASVYKKRIIHALSKPYKDGLKSSELMSKVNVPGIKGTDKFNPTEKRKCYEAIMKLKEEKTLAQEVIPTDKRRRINYLPENKESVKRKWGIESEVEIEGDEYLGLRISHTKDVQEEVVKPLYEKFKKIIYDWCTPMSEDENERFAEEGPPFVVVIMGEMGMEIPIYHMVEGTVLLDDFREHHAHVLFKKIDEFNEKYREYWKMYYKIHDRIRKLILTKMGGPIIQYPFHGKGITTNLQYWLYHTLWNYHIFGDSSIWDISFSDVSSIKKQGEIYEYWFLGRECWLRAEQKGWSEREDETGTATLMALKDHKEVSQLANEVVVDEIIGVVGKISKNGDLIIVQNIVFPDYNMLCDEINKRLKIIFMDVKESSEISKLMDAIIALRNELWELQHEILRGLERALKKKVLDGLCDYCIPKEETEQKKEDFRFDLFHKYLHEGLHA